MKIRHMECKRIFASSVVIQVLHSQITIAVSLVVGWCIDRVISVPGLYLQSVFFVLAAYLAQIVVATANDYFVEYFEIKEMQCMRNRAFTANLTQRYMGIKETAAFQALVNEQIPEVVTKIYSGFKHIINCTLSIVVSAVSLFNMNWIWALIILSASIAMVFFPRVFNKKVQDATKAYMEASSKYQLKLQSFLNGHSLIRAFSFYRGASSQMEEACQTRTSTNLKRLHYTNCVYGVSAALNLLQNAAILLVGLLFVMRGHITVGALFAAMQIAMNICGTMEALSYFIFQYHESTPMLEAYATLLNAEQANALKEANARPIDRVDAIEFVNGGYKVGELDILKEINFKVERGGRYLLCGESRSGKSTLLSLLAGSLKPTTGQLYVNKTALEHFNPSEYSKHVCLMPQNSYLFYATLRDNIEMGNKLSDDEYEELLHKTNLTELAARLKQSHLDENLLENLSGGEKQRICLARTMARKPDVYLLDEITASLDRKNADEILKILLSMQDVALVFVAHQSFYEKITEWTDVYKIHNGYITHV